METAFILQKLLTAIFLPPFNLWLLLVLAYGLWRLGYTKCAKSAVVFFAIFFYLFSTPWFANFLTQGLQVETPKDSAQPQLIVVLGGGVKEADWGQGYGLTALSLERLRLAVALQKQWQLPILVTGGSPEGTQPEAQVMATELQQFFQSKAQFLEARSHTTEQNAQFSKALLASQAPELQRILLVTHSWHMQRAKYLFERQGFAVIPAPVRPNQFLQQGIFAFVPQASALQQSAIAIKEYLGLLKLRLWG